MEGVSGISGAGRLWHRVMRDLHASVTPAPFPRAALEERSVCAASAPGDTACAQMWVERFVPGTGPSAAPPRPPKRDGLRVVYPDAGDVFSLVPDVPPEHARLHFRVELDGHPLDATRRVLWEVDGEMSPSALGGGLAWPARAGEHQVRAWLEPAPGEVAQGSPPVRFEVMSAEPSASATMQGP